MARNWIQFQKGYSLTQFVDEYGTEERCVAALFRWRWPNGFVCPRGSQTGHCRVQSRALYQCSGCRHQVSLTAGTILDSTKLPLRTWFLAMYLLTQTKNGISGKYQNPWGQMLSATSTFARPNAVLEHPLAFQIEDGLAV